MAVFFLTNFNDTQVGTTASDSLFGLGGNDRLFGSSGNDFIAGGLGNDFLDGGPGFDEARYGDVNAAVRVDLSITVAQNTIGGGIDTLINFEGLAGGNFNDFFRGNDAINQLKGGAGNDTLVGLGASDVLFGHNGNDSLFGNDGDDQLAPSTGNDRVQGGNGIDTIFMAELTFAMTVNLNLTTVQNMGFAGNKLILEMENVTGGSSNDVFTGNVANNILVGNGGNDILNGGNGNDSLNGGAGADSMLGGTGLDTYFIDNAGDRVTDADTNSIVKFVPAQDGQGLTANDAALANVPVFSVMEGDQFSNTLSAAGQAGRVTLIGNAGDDALGGGDGNDLIQGGDGNDNIAGLLGTGITGLEGGNGDDTIDGGNGNDILEGNDGNDILIGGNGDDTLDAGPGLDSLFGGAGRDSLTGGSGDNLLDGELGRDSMFGSNGNDVFKVDDAFDIVNEGSVGGTDLVIASSSYRISDVDVENLSFAFGTRSIHGAGNASANSIIGNNGNNNLFGEGGNDVLRGEGGDDSLDGGAGDDGMIGGLGNDTYVLDSVNDVAAEALNAGIDKVISSVTVAALPANIENAILTGTAAINLTGNNLSNNLFGNAANNIITDTAGGNDFLDGGNGDDTLIGGALADDLTGGPGADKFRYAAVTDGTFKNTNGVRGALIGDTIQDFFSSVDHLEFASAAFAGGVLGNGPVVEGTSISTIATQYDGTNPGVNANHVAKQATFVFSEVDSTLYYDSNGSDAGYTVIATFATGSFSVSDVIINP